MSLIQAAALLEQKLALMHPVILERWLDAPTEDNRVATLPYEHLSPLDAGWWLVTHS